MRSSATTTGLYLEGSPGIGLTVNGTRAMSLDANDLRVGDNATNGQPLLRHATPNESNPAYSFVGDEDTGMFWADNDHVALAVGGARAIEADTTPVSPAPHINIGGAVANNWKVAVSGMFEGEKVLEALRNSPPPLVKRLLTSATTLL